MPTEIAGETPDGAAIHAVTIENAHLRARVLSYGAALQDLRLAGVEHPLLLGLAEAADYATDAAPYFGVIVGRVANRIAGGRAEIGGRVLELDRNEDGARMLHGGSDGSGKRLWQVAEAGDTHVTLTDTLPDGHMGFPGSLAVSVTYRLDGPTLEIAISAGTDAPTFCNFASHAYWNLSGAERIDDHVLTLDAERYQPVDAGKIPDGPPAPVAGTKFDFRAGAMPPEIDHNLCLAEARRPLAAVGRLAAPGVTMEIATTEPGVQLYDGGALDVGGGLDGRRYGARAGLALEPQAWVDAPNQPFRAQVELAPGGRYENVTRLTFSATG